MSTGSISLPKWQIAVLLGVPLTIGLGYLVWRKQTEPIDDVSENSNKKKKELSKNKTISLDGDSSISENPEIKEGNQKVVKLPLEQAQEFKNDGNLHFKAGKFDEAIIKYDLAIELCPKTNPIDLSTFYQNRAAAYEQLKKWNSVKDDCTNALELNPKYTKALHRRARAYEQIKDLESCLEDITATCILEGFQNQNTLYIADRVLKELGRQHAKEAIKTRTPVTPSRPFVKNYFASFAQDPITKIVVASSEPKGFIKAKMSLDNQHFDDIIPACTDEIESSVAEAEYKMEAMLLRATFYLLTGRYAEALTDLDVIISNSEVDVKIRSNALIKRASLNMQIEKPEECFEDFSKAEELDEKNSDVYHHRGQVYILIERPDEALRDFQKAVQLSPDQAITFVHKCYAEYRLAFMSQDQYKLISVMNDFNKAIEKYPNCVECYSLMAQILTDQQQFEQADVFFEKALKIDPENATLYVHRGLLQLQWNGDANSACNLITKAMEIDDKCEFAYETLGTIEVQRGNLEKSIELFDKALKLAKSEMEMVHIFSLKDAATAQINVTKRMGIDVSSLSALAGGM